MTQAINTIIDKGLYEMYTSDVYQRINLRESDVYNEIIPSEYLTNTTISPTTLPQEINFTIPNKGYANVIQSSLSFSIGIPFSAGDLTGKTVVQQNCAIYTVDSASVQTSSAYTLKCRLPQHTQAFFTEFQVQKENMNNQELNIVQQYKHRETLFTRLASQEFVNRTGADNFLFNNDVKIIFKGAASDDTTTMVYVNFTLPFGNISPLLGIHPYFPLEILNKALKIRCVLNQDAFASVGTTYINFVMKMNLVLQSGIKEQLRMAGREIYGCFPDYHYVKVQGKTFSDNFSHIINQQIESLDVIQIQMSKNQTNTNYKLGFSNLTQESPYIQAEKYSIGGFQFTYNNQNMMIKPLKTWNDILRWNCKDGQQLSQFTGTSANKTSGWDFQEWNNQFIFKLEDEQNTSTSTSGYTGIPIKSENNATISWNSIYDYSSKYPVAQSLQTSDPVLYEIFLYYSRFMQITLDGDIILK